MLTFFQKRFCRADVGLSGLTLAFWDWMNCSACCLFLASRSWGKETDACGAWGGGPATVGCGSGVASLVALVWRRQDGRDSWGATAATDVDREQ